MNSIQLFNNLNNQVVTRSEIERIISVAKQENATDIIYRLSKILNENPTTERFSITITQYKQPEGLAGARHRQLS